MNILRIRILSGKQKKEKLENDATVFDEYVFNKHSVFVYENIIPFILIFNANMVDFSGTRFANMAFPQSFLSIKLIMIVICFLVILICNIAKKYPGTKTSGANIVCVLDVILYVLMAFMLMTLKHQRISFHVVVLSVLIILMLVYIPFKPAKIVWKSVVAIGLVYSLFVTVTDELKLQVKPYQFEEYTGTWVYERDDLCLQMYCEITKDGDKNNKLMIYQLVSDRDGVLLDYDIREYVFESYQMNKVLGTWYDYQEIRKIDEKELKGNAIPIQISFLEENIIHVPQYMNTDDGIYMYQDGEIEYNWFVFPDEIVKGEKRYSLIILEKELWLYGYLPFREIDSIPQNALSLLKNDIIQKNE